MNADDLRSVQAPLKERYRETPEAALITLHAEGRVGEGLSCRIETGKALVVAGLHPATGGSGQAACSGDMLLEALVACAGVTLNAVATALGIVLRDASLRAEGDLDFRGTLGLSKEVPVGFQHIRLQFTLDTDASEEQLATLLRLTERYCVVYQTLSQPPALTLTRKRAPGSAQASTDPSGSP
ncbi:OsmC family protein [Rhizobacter sp. Root1221]|uniref:OsmC family protein n=1 Tax=Rhizobacter sp. Root1221 TaxID=1736433 RepID=UPI0006F66DF5|nr:OsmC family protein [Rhizobacter sp. Root1221]KQV94572.1 peroxiredoxin [Rhizobacter sp. Root1221]